MIKVLLTGSSGRLGTEIRKIYKNYNIKLVCPSSTEMDITNCENVEKVISSCKPDLIIHSAAYTDVKRAESEISKAIDVNVIGTSNIVKISKLHDIKLVFISTDYVFDGEKGNYKTTDKINPISKYAKSKAAAELVASLYEKCMIIRTSFFGKVFPYEKAFVDQWTSKDYVDVMAPKILKLALSEKVGIYHCASTKRTIFEIAKQRNPQVKKISRKQLDFPTLKDTSLIEEK